MNPALQIIGLISIGIVLGWLSLGIAVYHITIKFKDKSSNHN